MMANYALLRRIVLNAARMNIGAQFGVDVPVGLHPVFFLFPGAFVGLFVSVGCVGAFVGEWVRGADKLILFKRGTNGAAASAGSFSLACS